MASLYSIRNRLPCHKEDIHLTSEVVGNFLAKLPSQRGVMINVSRMG